MIIKKDDVFKSWSNVKYRTDLYEKQTEVKHKFLENYLQVWMYMMCSYHGRLNYIDGFGGTGAYHVETDVEANEYKSKNFGSPIIAAQIIQKLKSTKKDKEINVLIMDTDEKKLSNISLILNAEKLDVNLSYRMEKGSFDVKINEFLKEIDSKRLAPTFFLVDPYGFSQIKMPTIVKIMQIKNSEIMINFMYNAIQRWVKDKKIEQAYTDLFGSEKWKEYADENTLEKEVKLIELFRNQCKKCADYVYPYKLEFPDIKRPYYYLFHLTNHYKGIVKSKGIFARHNFGDLEYKGEKQQLTFEDLKPRHERGDKCIRCFIGTESKKGCKECILSIIEESGSIEYGEIIEKLIDMLPITEQQIKNTLKILESKKLIKVEPSIYRKGRRRDGFINRDVLIFIK